MRKGSNKKYSMGVAQSLLISLLITVVVGVIIFTNPKISWFLDNIEWGMFYIIGLLGILFVGSYWNFSGGHWRTRDKMVSAMPGKNWYSRAGLLVVFFLLLGVTLGIMSLVFLAPLYQAAG